MLDPDELYVLEPDLPPMDRPVLVHALTGFIDAGSAGQLLRDHLLETLEHRLVATFDVDQLLDYRSRRPLMVFDADHWESYDEPSLELHAVTDSEGATFLLLEGAEPDVSWERFIVAVRHLVERLDVRLTIGVHGIPMGVPHTRPTAVTAHGTRPELTEGREPWVGRIQVPGSMINLLELRLGQTGTTRWASRCTCRTISRRPNTPVPPRRSPTRWPPRAGCRSRPPRCARPPRRPAAQIDEQVAASPRSRRSCRLSSSSTTPSSAAAVAVTCSPAGAPASRRPTSWVPSSSASSPTSPRATSPTDQPASARAASVQSTQPGALGGPGRVPAGSSHSDGA